MYENVLPVLSPFELLHVADALKNKKILSFQFKYFTYHLTAHKLKVNDFRCRFPLSLYFPKKTPIITMTQHLHQMHYCICWILYLSNITRNERIFLQLVWHYSAFSHDSQSVNNIWKFSLYYSNVNLFLLSYHTNVCIICIQHLPWPLHLNKSFEWTVSYIKCVL